MPRSSLKTPIRVTEQALQFDTQRSIDGVVLLGGGITIGLGKALSVRTSWQRLCIPTTYTGPGMTPILAEQRDGQKLTRRDPKILPSTVIYGMITTSAVNELAHAVEASYAPNMNPIISLLAVEGAQPLANGLPDVIEPPEEKDSQEHVLYGAWLSGLCLGSTDMSLHHKLCYTLGGSLNSFLREHIQSSEPDTSKNLVVAFAEYGEDTVSALNRFLNELGVKRALRDFGMKEEVTDKVA
ncbi:Dehydroquinate synthase-like protein [Plenodomus tracheiphilus IPT5]|uniref:Dehydroquinate synthase-like protein n=1 Tax=Plenodomus tracheiphilus IPT5 TaxID=1408161 RepID=A0A6A7B5S9_9PLEO|nr:Dehydroquinate synthase-like protein [Plenodomus tracheiphilus IPT5]